MKYILFVLAELSQSQQRKVDTAASSTWSLLPTLRTTLIPYSPSSYASLALGTGLDLIKCLSHRILTLLRFCFYLPV